MTRRPGHDGRRTQPTAPTQGNVDGERTMSTNAPSSSSTLTYADIAARPIVLTVEQAAERLGIGRTLMYSLVSSGAVESVTIGRLRRIPTDALALYVDSLRSAEGGAAA